MRNPVVLCLMQIGDVGETEYVKGTAQVRLSLHIHAALSVPFLVTV